MTPTRTRNGLCQTVPDHILGGGKRKPSNTSLVSLTLRQLGLCVAHTAELVECSDEIDEANAAIPFHVLCVQEFLLLRHHVFAQDPQPLHVAKASLRLLFGSRGQEKLRDCCGVIALEQGELPLDEHGFGTRRELVADLIALFHGAVQVLGAAAEIGLRLHNGVQELHERLHLLVCVIQLIEHF